MSDKNSALKEIVVLVEKYNITLDEIGAHLTRQSVKSGQGKWITPLLAYLGAAFIFGGLALLMTIIWPDLGSASRVILSYGPGIVAFVLGVMCVRDSRFEKASTALFLKSAILLPTGMFVFLHEYADGNDAQLAAMIVFGILAIQFLSAFYQLRRTSLLFFGFLFWNGAVGILMDRVDIPGEILGSVLGASIIMISYGLDQTVYRGITPFWYFLGGAGFLWSVFDIIEDNFMLPDLLYLPVTIFMMLLSVRMKSRTLLFVSTFALLGFLGYFTDRHFADVIGWPIALIVLGFILIGVSAKAVQLGQRISIQSEKI